MEKLRSINQKKKSRLGGLGPSWTGSHMAALCPQLPLELAKRDRAWEELDLTPSCWLAGHEGTDWNIGSLPRTVGGTQTTHACLGTRRTGLLCLLGLGTKQADVNSGSEGTPSSSPSPAMESMGEQSPEPRDMGHLCPWRLRDHRSRSASVDNKSG